MNQATTEKIKTSFWGAVVGAILTMVVGFAWGGWVLGSSSLSMGEKMAETALVERLTPICVAQYNQDPARDTKLLAFKEVDAWKRAQYVKEQGWATMPFETEPDSRVADSCANLITKNNQ